MPGTCVKKIQHQCFWGQNRKLLGGWRGNREDEEGEVRWGEAGKQGTGRVGGRW